MNLFIDESGNTGEALTTESAFNFDEQPYYVLTGVFVGDDILTDFSSFISTQIIKHRIQPTELKAKTLYSSKPKFMIELVDYMILKRIPFFIELMDKLYYLNTLLVEHVFLRYPSKELIGAKNELASNLTNRLNHNIYNEFVLACKSNSSEALEAFYDTLTKHFAITGDVELQNHIKYTKSDYLKDKAANGQVILKKYLPLPDENPNKKSIHFLTGYSAFTGVIARAQKYSNNSLSGQFNIIHDKEEHHSVIYQSAFEMMKKMNIDRVVADLISSEFETYNINEANNLFFQDSKSIIYLQVADLISGFVMRFWKDYIREDVKKKELYLKTMEKLICPYKGTGVGVRFFTSNNDHRRFTQKVNINPL